MDITQYKQRRDFLLSKIGKNGIENIIEYELNNEEMLALKKSARGVAENIAKLEL